MKTPDLAENSPSEVKEKLSNTCIKKPEGIPLLVDLS